MYKKLSNVKRCFVIAEIGSNHNGNFDDALRLMDIAQHADADAVKFQSFLANQLVKPNNSNYDLLKNIELPREWYGRLMEEAKSRGLIFFSTATNLTTIGWLEEVGVELYKIASPNLTHLPLIQATADLGKPTIMSTGMANSMQISEAVGAFTYAGNAQLALLHCVSEYPTAPENLNLRVINTLSDFYPYPVGFSDHSMSAATSVAAVALGAKIIEKHITLDRKSTGPDHHYALEPNEFLSMVRDIRIVENSLGDGIKHISSDEINKSHQYWRSLHFSKNLPAGSILTKDDFSVVRPNDGLHSRYFDIIIGMRLCCEVKAGTPINWHMFK